MVMTSPPLVLKHSRGLLVICTTTIVAVEAFVTISLVIARVLMVSLVVTAVQEKIIQALLKIIMTKDSVMLSLHIIHSSDR